MTEIEKEVRNTHWTDGLLAVLNLLVVMVIGPILIVTATVVLTYSAGQASLIAFQNSRFLPGIVFVLFAIAGILLFIFWAKATHEDYRALWGGLYEIYKTEYGEDDD